jgi:hypothetical protein
MKQQTLKMTTMREFTKLDVLEKAYLLKNMATLIDTYMDKGNMVYIYSLSDFFVEATVNPATETIIDMIPYKRGFFTNKSYLNNHLRQNILSYVLVA